MRQRERAMIEAAASALGSVPGVTNPADTKALADYHNEMQKVRGLVYSVLYYLALGDTEEANEALTKLQKLTGDDKL